MTTLKIGNHNGPQRSYLVDLLPVQGITSKYELAKFIERNYQKDEATPFVIVRSEDLGIDSEGRLYQDEVDFENVIVDAPLLNLQNSRKISLINCLFTGDLRIGQKRDDFDNAYLDHCIICKQLQIASLKPIRIELCRVNAPAVHISLLECAKRLLIVECHFGGFCFERSSADEFFTYLNRFEQFEITDCDLKKVTFDHRQFSRLLGTKPSKHFNEFAFAPKIDWGEQVEIDRSARVASTVRFILENSNIQLDRDAMANAKYMAALASKKDTWGRFFNRLFGAFIKPERVLCLVFLGIIGFALLYMIPFWQFNMGEDQEPQHGLDLLTAVYYSGISFSTIGYGDITPVGPARFLAVLEGLSGVTLMSAFVVALTRKYVD